MTGRKPPPSFKTEDFRSPPTGGDWVSLPAEGHHLQRLRRILHLVVGEGVMLSTLGDYYLVGDGDGGYVIRNERGPMDCPCKENRDGTDACSHLWALRAVRAEFFPGWTPDTSEEDGGAGA